MKKYIQAAAIWILLIPLAILNGGLRENVLKRLGDMALPLSGIILSLCIFAMSYLLIPKIKNCTSRDYVMFGVLWFLLTNLFDLSMFFSEGGGFLDLLKAYDFTTGNLWILVVATASSSPYLVSKIGITKSGE